ncbi:transcriptional regulator [Pseudoxanthomonas sp. CAU 1598]|uniref:Transcriptional regulator n=1 Tax=Pseudomarimonas arenosa TaxID=2774145 RepID=A0AAW3ZTV0_9GAMM|nr:transcriptional regulator [Pseudomarimonas arenosa]
MVWLRLSDLIQQRRRGRSSLYRDVAQGLLPPPVRVAANTSAWPAHELGEIDKARLAGADDEAIRALVANLVAARKVAA